MVLAEEAEALLGLRLLLLLSLHTLVLENTQKTETSIVNTKTHLEVAVYRGLEISGQANEFFRVKKSYEMSTGGRF